MTEQVRQLGPTILEEIKKAKSILLHSHPSPDMDSVGGALAMMQALEQLGKKVTVIRGDSDIPHAFSNMPGFEKIVSKHFFELDLNEYDLFIVQDSSSIGMISRHQPVVFPETLKVIVIDHHRTNEKFGSINLVDSTYPANCQILFDLFKLWNITFTKEIAVCLFMGMYTDTGGFKYYGTTKDTFLAVAELVGLAPDYTKIISNFENSNSAGYLKFLSTALNSISTHFNNTVAISSLTHAQIFEGTGIGNEDVRGRDIANYLRSVEGWNVGISMMEESPDEIKISFRTRDGDKYDVSKIAVAIGGGGHKAAAGGLLKMPLPQAKQKMLEAIGKVYPEWGSA